MPRKARIDIEGCLYHVVGRGIERGRIFLDEPDYEDFLERLKNGLEKTGAQCLAWCLMPNHFHLLIHRRQRSLSELMKRVMTGYAVGFNITHRRSGHLFQNRYKAILCDAEEYLLELVAYIHLNPLRAGIVKNPGELTRYKWSGHGALAGKCACDFIEKDSVWRHFGKNRREAVSRYEVFVKERAGKYKGGEYSGGGLIKSIGGLANVLSFRRSGEMELSDDRVLGSGDFVERILKEAGDSPKRRAKIEEIMCEVEKNTGVSAKDIASRSQCRKTVEVRAVYCYRAKEQGGVKGVFLMKQLGMSSGAISHLVERGKILSAGTNNGNL